MKYDDIKDYKIIIYDLNDSGYCDTNNPKDIKKYLLEGGSIIITHDHWTNHKLKDDSELLGIKFISQNNPETKKAKMLNNMHPVFTSFYQLDNKNETIIDIAKTHKHNMEFENKEEYKKNLLMELDDGKHGEYLFIKDIGKGKLILWNTGHSYYDGSINDNLTDYEQKLFINFIYYILS